jgi:hypothetical protein
MVNTEVIEDVMKNNKLAKFTHVIYGDDNAPMILLAGNRLYDKNVLVQVDLYHNFLDTVILMPELPQKLFKFWELVERPVQKEIFGEIYKTSFEIWLDEIADLINKTVKPNIPHPSVINSYPFTSASLSLFAKVYGMKSVAFNSKFSETVYYFKEYDKESFVVVKSHINNAGGIGSGFHAYLAKSSEIKMLLSEHERYLNKPF